MHVTRIVVLSALVAGAGTILSAQSPGWTPMLEIRLEAARPTGDRTGASGTFALVAGQPVTSSLISSSDLCAMGGGLIEMSRNSTNADTLWKFTASLLSSDSNGYRVRIDSQFERFATGVAPPPSTTELVLREDQDATLEMWRATVDGPCHVRNVAVRARIVLRAADASVETSRYTVDAWLVDTDAAGIEKRQHLDLALWGVTQTTFSFDSLRIALPSLSPLQGDLAAYLQVSGSLRARPRTDGQIDVDLQTARGLSLRRSNEPSKSSGGSAGSKVVTLREDETVAIDLPQPASGYAAVALTPDAKFNVGGGARAGGASSASSAPTVIAEVKDNVMHVNTALLLKGRKTQLLIRLRKARE